MKVKDLLDIVNNVDYVVISKTVNTYRYYLENVPKEYNDLEIKEISIYFESTGYKSVNDTILWLEVEND